MKHTKGSHSDDFNDTEPCYCDEVKPMQNNETKWEEERQSANNLAELFFRDIDYGKKDKRNQEEVKDEVIKSASNLIFYKLKEVYQKGRNEMSEIGLETTLLGLRLTKKVEKRTRLKTLEEVEKVIKKEKTNDEGQEWFKYNLLQTINKMKTNERHN